MSSVAAVRLLAAPAVFMVRAREEINALPTPKYVVPPFRPFNFPEGGRGVQSQPRFQSPTRVADSTVEAEMQGCCRYEWGK